MESYFDIINILIPSLIAGSIAIWQLKRRNNFERKEKLKAEFREILGNYIGELIIMNTNLMYNYAENKKFNTKAVTNDFHATSASLTRLFLVLDDKHKFYTDFVKAINRIDDQLADIVKEKKNSLDTSLILDLRAVGKKYHDEY